MDTPDHHALLLLAVENDASVLPSGWLEQTADCSHSRFGELRIADVRSLITTAFQRPLAAPRRRLVVFARSIAPEAQHALLKILEEPPETTQFLFILPTRQSLLPTLTSRLHQLPNAVTTEPTHDLFTEFLAAPLSERMETIATLSKDKDEAALQALFVGAGSYAAGPDAPLAVKRSVTTALSFHTLRGASKKMLLEHIALTLPVQKQGSG